MEKVKKEMREILPIQGIWTVGDFAIYLGMNAAVVQDKLSEIGVKTYRFGREYRKRIFHLEDLKMRGEA